MKQSVLNRIIQGKEKTVFDADLNKSIQYMNTFSEPKSLLDRSYFQYKCQAFLKGWRLTFFHNLIAFFLLIPFIFYLLLNKKKYAHNFSSAVLLDQELRDIFPKSLNKEFAKIEIIDSLKRYYLCAKDIVEVSNLLFRFFYSPYFLLKLIYKMGIYRYAIDKYSPTAIMCTSEYSFTSSYLTEYCRKNNIMHINIMHGEKLLYIRDTFFQFDRCYVWDAHYLQLFKKLRAEQSQFIIEPLYENLKITENKPCQYKLTYYLNGDETKNNLIALDSIIKSTRISPTKINIRPHPLYGDINLVKNTLKEYNIELPNQIEIQESIRRTEFIVSLFSTVLYQAYLMKKTTVIDDLLNKENYLNLKKLDYIMINKCTFKFSELVQKIKQNK